MFYVIDALHFVDAKGAIGPKRGKAKEMSDFLASVIVAGTLTDPNTIASPRCIRCTAPVEASIDPADAVIWRCTACEAAGRISNWQGTFWDMTAPAQIA